MRAAAAAAKRWVLMTRACEVWVNGRLIERKCRVNGNGVSSFCDADCATVSHVRGAVHPSSGATGATFGPHEDSIEDEDDLRDGIDKLDACAGAIPFLKVVHQVLHLLPAVQGCPIQDWSTVDL
ncbi:hypothetical protein GCM10007382_06320 [Salinibacterium xinjiangense]|nr:hypothetical protein GCM10007382_06320 [Salinibacterium xinjiangense]